MLKISCKKPEYYYSIYKNMNDTFEGQPISNRLSFDEIISKTIPKTELKDWSHFYYNCDCCIRHQLNKSIIINNTVKVECRDSFHITNIDNCDCICRQFGRKLAKLYKL
jgi:hypothetical protein